MSCQQVGDRLEPGGWSMSLKGTRYGLRPVLSLSFPTVSVSPGTWPLLCFCLPQAVEPAEHGLKLLKA